MTYEEIARTFNIIASKNPTGLFDDWATHDEWGIRLFNVDLSPAEVRELAEMGWSLGSDSEFDEEEMKPWINPNDHSDEEIMELWNDYKKEGMAFNHPIFIV